MVLSMDSICLSTSTTIFTCKHTQTHKRHPKQQLPAPLPRPSSPSNTVPILAAQNLNWSWPLAQHVCVGVRAHVHVGAFVCAYVFVCVLSGRRERERVRQEKREWQSVGIDFLGTGSPQEHHTTFNTQTFTPPPLPSTLTLEEAGWFSDTWSLPLLIRCH